MLSNSVLTEITPAGALDDTGDPTTGTPAWEGRAQGYLKRMDRQEVSGGQQVTVHETVFFLLTSMGAPAIESAGPDWQASTVVIEDQRTTPPVTRRWTVDGMENRMAGTIVDSIRLQLTDPRDPG